jgi:hypothetical protein
MVRKKAALASLRLLRSAPEEYPHGEFNGRILQMLSHDDVVRDRRDLPSQRIRSSRPS